MEKLRQDPVLHLGVKGLDNDDDDDDDEVYVYFISPMPVNKFYTFCFSYSTQV
jgi:hypothetical protein